MWFIEENEDGNEMSIYIGGLDLECKSVNIRVIDFHPHVYLELPQKTPRGENWSEVAIRSLFTYFQRTFNPPPLTCKPVMMKNIYSLKPAKLLRLTFPSYSSTRKFASACSKRGFTVEGVGTFKIAELIVHEHNIDPILKFTSEMNINLTGWLQVQEYIPKDELTFTDEERRFSSSVINMTCRIEDIKSVIVDMSVSTTIKPKYMSFDIECYSENHNSKLPDPTLKNNPVFHISAIVGRFGCPKNERKRYLLTLFNPSDIENCTIIRYGSEEELLLGFTHLIQDENPDMFLGYNILKFDFNYLIERSKLLGILDEFLMIGRIIDRVCQPISVNWSSSAYGKQVFQMPNVDRTQMDMLVEVERNFKLSDYRLDTVAKEFLGQEKLDVSPKQLFKLFNLTQESTKILSKPITKESFLNLRRKISDDILPLRQCQGVVRELRKDLLDCKTLTSFRGVIDKAMYLTGKYCVHDSELVIDIAEKLNTLTSMEELAGVTHVPMAYLQTRGQQIKVLAQVYRLAQRENIFISSIVPIKEKKFAGATVVTVRSGRFDNVITLDFASLYPSIIIARNICYTTLEKNESKESECIVVKFGEHRACEHDMTIRKTKVKESEKLCEEHKYMFNRPKYFPDGSSTGQGLLPRLVKGLMTERKRVKKDMEMYEAKIAISTGKMPEKEIEEWSRKGVTAEKDDKSLTEWKMIQKVLDARQIALKLVCNSTYGTLGVSKGYLPLPEGAASVTATGRQLIEGASQFIEKVFADKGAKLVYGDSVSKDTPILCRLKGKIFYRKIDSIPFKNWFNVGDKEQSLPIDGLEVWSDEGFTPIVMIIRHKTTKKMFKVVTDTGVVIVTEDHSLLSPNGGIIKTSDVIVGTQLLTKALPKVHGDKVLICPYTKGLFVGDGCEYKSYWSISNIDVNILTKARTELETIYPNVNTKIVDRCCYKYKLLIRKNKIVNLSNILEEIFDCTIECQNMFLEGLCDSDGDIIPKIHLDYANIYLIANNITNSTNPTLYLSGGDCITISFRKSDNPSAIRSIECLGECIDEFVYDLETKNHHFAAGVGQIVVHNTDSTFIQFSKELSRKEVYALGPIISKETSHYLRCKLIGLDENKTVNINDAHVRFDKIKESDLSKISDDDKCRWYEYQATPMNLEFEKMFGSLVMLTKKRYIGEIVNSDGKIIKTLKKGVMVVRRDNCKWARDVYTSVMNSILIDKTKDEIMNIITDSINDLYTMKIKDVDLVIVVGVKDVKEYADKKIQKEPSSDINPFIDIDRKAIRGVTDPLDSRLVYKNKLQAKLCLKMLRRGDTVPPNTRLEYVLLDIGHDDKTITTGDRVEDYTYYRENKDETRSIIDRAEYVRKISTPINEILNVAFPPKVRLFEKVEERFLRLCDEVKNEIIKQRLVSKRKIADKLKFIFETLRDNSIVHRVIQTVKRSDGSVYKRTIEKREPKQNTIHISKHPELISATQNLNSRLVLTRLFKSYKLRMPSEHRPKDGSIVIDDDPIGSIYKSKLEWICVLNDIKNGLS